MRIKLLKTIHAGDGHKAVLRRSIHKVVEDHQQFVLIEDREGNIVKVMADECERQSSGKPYWE